MADPTLRLGSSGPAVSEAQYYLINLMYLPSNTLAGYFGPVMMGAVQAFQKKNGLSADGVIGPNTWSLLRSPAAVSASGVPTQNVSFTPTVVTGAPLKTGAPAVNAAWEFEAVDVVGKMPSRGFWSGLSPVGKAVTVSLGLGALLLAFGDGKGR